MSPSLTPLLSAPLDPSTAAAALESPLDEQQQLPVTAAESPALKDCQSILPSFPPSLCSSQETCWGWLGEGCQRLRNLQENSRDSSIELTEGTGRWRDSAVNTTASRDSTGLAFLRDPEHPRNLPHLPALSPAPAGRLAP